MFKDYVLGVLFAVKKNFLLNYIIQYKHMH